VLTLWELTVITDNLNRSMIYRGDETQNEGGF